MYQASVPVSSGAGHLFAFLISGRACRSEEIDPAVFIAARLAPDMFALARQVQIACDAAKIGARGWPAPRRRLTPIGDDVPN